MPFSGKKGKGFDLDCIAQNFNVTVVTCCGFIYQGTIEDDDHTRAQYGYPVVFPTMTMDYGGDKEDDKKDDKECDKKEHCPKPIEVDVDVKLENDPKFICLKLNCVPTYICCTTVGTPPTTVAQIVPVATTNPTTTTGNQFLFAVGNTVLINVKDIVTLGPTSGSTCFFTPA